jgi:O-antigen/teichoic acid export membrane protein
MLTSGLHNYSASRVAELYFGGRASELQRLLARVMMLALVLVTILVLLITGAGPWLLALFGNDYRSEYDTLMVLATVSAFATLAGPGGMMMLTMGRERLYLTLVVGALAIRVAALVVLVPTMGILGAAIAVGIAILPFVVVVTVLCIRDIGVDPSILSIFRKTRIA